MATRPITSPSSSISSTEQKKMSNRIAQLRKVCNHPFLFVFFFFGNEYLIRSCGKLALLDRILPKLQRGGHRVLVYSQMVKLLSLLKFYCEIKGYRHMVLSGETASDDRIAMVSPWWLSLAAVCPAWLPVCGWRVATPEVGLRSSA